VARLFRGGAEAMKQWIAEELRDVALGDARLDRRYALLLDRLSAHPMRSIPAACRGWSETQAAYRFFSNARVDVPTLLGPHYQATQRRIAQEPVVLLAQDTSELDLTRREERVRGSGPLNATSRQGFFVHPMLSMTPACVPLGLVDAKIWARDEATFGQTGQRGSKPIEQKESYRWLTGYRRACEVAAAAPSTTVIALSDSEGDIYECLAESSRREAGAGRADWIVRACQNRCTVDAAGASGALLWDTVARTPVLGASTVSVRRSAASSHDGRRRRQGRRSREATVKVRATSVTLKAPSRPGGQLENVTVQAILVREESAPADEPPVEWLLLTSLPIEDFEAIQTVIAYYCCRWQIEIYFRVLKSGCRVEALQLETAERFQACLALYLIVAWRVLSVIMLGRHSPDAPCDVAFEPHEWKSVYHVVAGEPVPADPPLLGEMVDMVARLGGYLGRKHDSPPGPKAMWIGMQRMMDFSRAWLAFGPESPHAPTRRTCV